MVLTNGLPFPTTPNQRRLTTCWKHQSVWNVILKTTLYSILIQ